MKSHRSRSSGWLEFKSVDNLPFCIQTIFLDKQNMTWREDFTRIVYVRLKVADEQYEMTDDNEGFDFL